MRLQSLPVSFPCSELNTFYNKTLGYCPCTNPEDVLSDNQQTWQANLETFTNITTNAIKATIASRPLQVSYTHDGELAQPAVRPLHGTAYSS
jgi:hypothetical protein